jgi:hypothetical protein
VQAASALSLPRSARMSVTPTLAGLTPPMLDAVGTTAKPCGFLVVIGTTVGGYLTPVPAGASYVIVA